MGSHFIIFKGRENNKTFRKDLKDGYTMGSDGSKFMFLFLKVHNSQMLLTCTAWNAFHITLCFSFFHFLYIIGTIHIHMKALRCILYLVICPLYPVSHYLFIVSCIPLISSLHPVSQYISCLYPGLSWRYRDFAICNLCAVFWDLTT